MDRWPPYGGGREGRFDCIYMHTSKIFLFSHCLSLRSVASRMNHRIMAALIRNQSGRIAVAMPSDPS